ncbi:MAG: glycosyltransferase family 39 protein [Dokdonella sp.]
MAALFFDPYFTDGRSSMSPTDKPWRDWLENPLAIALLFLLPIALLLPPLPIDETRYLAVAWEMRQSGNFLVPHLNGELYSQKPPLLFWLINASWTLTGLHGWSARLVTLASSLLSLFLIGRIALRLGGDRDAARCAQWVLLGIGHFAIFANAIMFDIVLTTCVLIALYGVLDLADDRRSRGVLIAGLGIGLGVLTKGPVILLDVGFAAATAPWWHAGVAARKGRYFGALGIAVLLGAAIGLAWAIPAAIVGGDVYANAIFLKQTVGRVTSSFAHRRPFWWYAWLLPLMLMPWLLVLRGRWSELRQRFKAEPALGLALLWTMPTVLVFSLVSGKQGHYLLPILPGFALALGVLIAHGALRVRVGVMGFLVVLLGIALAIIPHLATTRDRWNLLIPLWPWWGILLVLLGVALIVFRRRLHGVLWPTLTTLVLVLVLKLALLQGTGDHYDPRAAAAEVRKLQDSGASVLQYGWHHGVYEFAGQLQKPLPWRYHANDVREWLQAHPDGYLIVFETKLRPATPPLLEIPFRGSQFAVWPASAALAGGIPDRDGTPDVDED